MRIRMLFLIPCLLLLAANASQAEYSLLRSQLSAGHPAGSSATYSMRGIIGLPIIFAQESENWYLLQGFWRSSDNETSAVAMSTGVYTLQLSHPAPNPAKSGSTIQFVVSGSGEEVHRVHLSIYDVSGRLVRTLIDGTLSQGPHSVIWDGKNNEGARVQSGVYYCRYSSEGKNLVKSLVVLK